MEFDGIINLIFLSDQSEYPLAVIFEPAISTLEVPLESPKPLPSIVISSPGEPIIGIIESITGLRFTLRPKIPNMKIAEATTIIQLIVLASGELLRRFA